MYDLKTILVLVSFMLFILIGSTQDCETYNIPSEHLGGISINQAVTVWSSSGAIALPITVTPDRQFDVSEYEILPNGQPCGNEIYELIDSLEPTIESPIVLYFPPGAYYIEVPLVLNGYAILKGAGGDGELPLQTHFHFNLGINWNHPCITVAGEKNGIEDIFIIDDTPYTPTISVTEIPEYFYDGILTYQVIGANSMQTTVSIGEADICGGMGTIIGSTASFYCNGELFPDIGYGVTTEFCNEIECITVQHIAFKYNSDAGYKQKKDINIDIPIQSTHKTENTDSPDSYYQNTIVISGKKNWIRGVESGLTRKYHVYIGGDAKNNTISGCYFHHAADYSDNGGRGYGVCISGTAFRNRIEDNIFKYLRHSIVLQGGALYNVIGYNYSREVHAFNIILGEEFPYDAHDLLLHGRMDGTSGPASNLLEGNYVIRSAVDDVHDYNGPYNTFLRNRATDNFKVYQVPYYWHHLQYAQNVIGCNMPPTDQTKNRLEDFGYLFCYPDYGSLPVAYCSFYLFAKPEFFSWIDWPYTPWPESIIPAKYRWDSHQGYYPPVPYTIFQGWDNYEYLCGPPNYTFTDKTWENTEEEYFAMQKIELNGSEIVQNTDLYLHAEENVLLKPGTKIYSNGNHVTIKAGNVCYNKESNKSKYSIYDKFENKVYADKDLRNQDVTKTSEIEDLQYFGLIAEETNGDLIAFPNPSKGAFYINLNSNCYLEDLTICGVLGNKLDYDLFKDQNFLMINLKENYHGLILIRIKTNDGNRLFKAIVE